MKPPGIHVINGQKYHVAQMFLDGVAVLYLWRTLADKSRGYTCDVGFATRGQPILFRTIMAAYDQANQSGKLVLTPAGVNGATFQDDNIPGALDHATPDQAMCHGKREDPHRQNPHDL